MNAAIFYSGTYGSTAQYASWIGEATGLPVFSIDDAAADPAAYDLLVLGSSVIVFRLTIRKWVKKNWKALEGKPVILFSVSGAGGGPKVDRWVAKSLPAALVERVKHVALGGRLDHATVPWWIQWFLKIGALINRDPEASKDERAGFDYVDRDSIGPVVEHIERLLAPERAA